MGDQTVMYFNSANADQASGNSRSNRQHLKTTRATAMIKISRQTIQLPPRCREQLYKKLSMEAMLSHYLSLGTLLRTVS